MLVQPEMVFPIAFVITAQRMPIKLSSAIMNPNPEIILMGFTDILVMPSIASATIFFSG